MMEKRSKMIIATVIAAILVAVGCFMYPSDDEAAREEVLLRVRVEYNDEWKADIDARSEDQSYDMTHYGVGNDTILIRNLTIPYHVDILVHAVRLINETMTVYLFEDGAQVKAEMDKLGLFVIFEYAT